MSTNGARFECDLFAAAEPLEHVWEHTVGSGHATLALRADWQTQLARCRKELGFRHVRFHGLLSDDVGTLVNEKGKLVQSFFNADQICDFLRSIEMRPFVELSFMPTALASGGETVFHYQGNVTPPKDYGAWEALVRDLATHWVQRYGREEVSQWLFEVWNEPNLEAFWKGTQADYFRLYRHTARALKSVCPSLQVGGPATAKNAWIPEFTRFCAKNEVPYDFVSTHHYPTDALGDASDDTVAQLAESPRSVLREQAETAKRQAHGKPLYYTEWCSSSNPFDELHDQPYAASFIVKTVMEARALVQGYSYWTFSDLFEENYFDSRPFHGGFGLLNINGVPKPAYRAFELLHRAGNEILPVKGRHPTVDLWVTRRERRVTVLATNWAQPRHSIEAEFIQLRLKVGREIRSAVVERIDDDHANVWQAWVEMGRPGSLSPQQVHDLEKFSALEKEPIAPHLDGSEAVFTIAMPPRGAVMMTLELGDLPTAENDEGMLEKLQRETFSYFTRERSSRTGLIADSSEEGSPASIAAVGLGLSATTVAVERGLMSRQRAAAQTLATLRFFHQSPQGPEPEATGYHGFYYHFLEMRTGQRTKGSELSTMDTALLAAGFLSAGLYFHRQSAQERQIRELADLLYRRIEWSWAVTREGKLSHGWKPESGFLGGSWSEGYCEAHILYLLALGSPTFPISPDLYLRWTSTFERLKVYDIEYLHADPLFIHQLSHAWVDFRGLFDDRTRTEGYDYFENSRRATEVQRQYAIENPHGFEGYSKTGWGLTASHGPGPSSHEVDGRCREFYGYLARGAPCGPDDGTLSPWAVVSSLPFAPEAVCETIRHVIQQKRARNREGHGFDASYNLTYPGANHRPRGWVSPWKYGLHEGLMVLMIENHLSGFPWSLFRRCEPLITGLRRAGFTEGCLPGLGGYLSRAPR